MLMILVNACVFVNFLIAKALFFLQNERNFNIAFKKNTDIPRYIIC